MRAKETIVVDGAYKVAITNVARYIRTHRPELGEHGGMLDGFTASMVLSVAFCKAKEEVLSDILRVEVR